MITPYYNKYWKTIFYKENQSFDTENVIVAIILNIL